MLSEGEALLKTEVANSIFAQDVLDARNVVLGVPEQCLICDLYKIVCLRSHTWKQDLKLQETLNKEQQSLIGETASGYQLHLHYSGTTKL